MPENGVTYTHPDVFTVGVRDGWADPETDPTRIHWQKRQNRAAIPFKVINGRPLNPFAPTGIRHGRNQLGHWGEQLAADALVSLKDEYGNQWILLIERDDGHGWAIPGGSIDEGETPAQAAVRELAEETGLTIPAAAWQIDPPQYVPDPRASDEAWIVTFLAHAHLGRIPRDQMPSVKGDSDALRAQWAPADSYQELAAFVRGAWHDTVFQAHIPLLQNALA